MQEQKKAAPKWAPPFDLPTSSFKHPLPPEYKMNGDGIADTAEPGVPSDVPKKYSS